MIMTIEQRLYDFLCEKLKDKGFNVYRGFLPENDHETREQSNKKKNEYFPFVILRITHFEQSRVGIDTYLTPIDFELWIGTKEDKEEDYIKNLSIGDFLRKELLIQSTQDKLFAIDASYPFTVDFYSEESEPYFYSMCKFRAFGIPEESEIVQKKVLALLGRSE